MSTIAGNVLGAATTLGYFHLVDLHMSGMRGTYAPSLAVLLLLLSGAVLTGTLVVRAWRRPLPEFARAIDAGRAASPAMMQAARIKVSRYPLVAAGVTWFTYLFVGLAFPATCARLGLMEDPRYVAGFLGYGVVAGIPASAVAFFAVERLMRPAVSLLFEEASLSPGPAWLTVNVHHRLLFVFLLIGILPVSVLGSAAYDNARSLLENPSGAALAHLLAVVMFVAGASALLSIALSVAVARSVADPINELLERMREFGTGHLGARVRVFSTDELGRLAHGFNAMARSLEAASAELRDKSRRLEEALAKVQLLQRAKEELAKFVPSAVRQLVDEARREVEGQTAVRDASVLFLDIAGYTRLSEALDYGRVDYLVEKYFSAYLEDIHRNGGDINETAGDGLMIIFQGGDPRDHARAAVRTALAIVTKTEAINRGLRADEEAIRVRIGINSGSASVGVRRFQTISGERWTYTASGPTTNVAARLVDLAKEEEILLGEDTAARVEGLVRLVRGRSTLKNVSQPVGVYQVVTDGRAPGYSVPTAASADASGRAPSARPGEVDDQGGADVVSA